MSENISVDETCALAPSPFNKSSADITLRSRDHINFLVSSHILSESSLFFADMFTLPQQPDGKNARPIIDVTEDSMTLERLLRLCYPIPKEELGGLDDIVPVLKAATKYDMRWPIMLLTRDLLAIASQSPLRVWAIACQSGLASVAVKAASALRERSNSAESKERIRSLEMMIEEEGLDVFRDISAGDYYRLREFLRAGAVDDSFTPLIRSQPTMSLSSTLLSGFVSGYASDLPALGTSTRAVALLPQEIIIDRVPKPVNDHCPRNPPPDVSLISSDGDVFEAHQLMLSFHSSHLKKLFTAGTAQCTADQPSGESPVDPRSQPMRPLQLQLEVDSVTLSSLLSVCYDNTLSFPLELTLSELARILAATEKYEMTQITRMAKTRWDERAGWHALSAYFIALQYRMYPLARAAARLVIREPIAGVYVKFMEDSSALAYHRLLVYYARCARTAETVLDESPTDWHTSVFSTGKNKVFIGHSYMYMSDQSWFRSHVETVREALNSDGPGRDLGLSAEKLLERSFACNVNDCWPRDCQPLLKPLVQTFIKFGASLPQAVKDAIDDVELEV